MRGRPTTGSSLIEVIGGGESDDGCARSEYLCGEGRNYLSPILLSTRRLSEAKLRESVACDGGVNRRHSGRHGVGCDENPAHLATLGVRGY